ncbi:CHAT domain-containing protein [Massilia sp. TSP1-1-2]|uniref:CHAT domain-containing protein n=1 Tax=unclassified Massilia TaxID=2609279 RepID=UPI003CF30C39
MPFLNAALRKRLLTIAALLCTGGALAQTGASSAEKAQARSRDAETVKSLSAEGQLLYQKERIKLDGAMYCAQAVALAEKGEFRLSIQAASKALVLGKQASRAGLVASAKRDLAIAYNYAGDLEHAAQYAQESLEGEGAANPAVAAPAYKIIGDVALRRGQPNEAISAYQKAQAIASARFKPLVDISLANAYVAASRPQEARAVFAAIAPSENLALRQAYLRGMGNLALAEGKPLEAMQHFSAAAAQAGGSDIAYHRLWAQEGRARSLLALGDKKGATAAYVDAARASELIRARFRSEEFKAGLFGDVQQIFDRAIALSAETGDAATAWQLSESSRSRALLDVLRERVTPATNEAASAMRSAAPDLAQLRGALRAGDVVIEFHSLEDRLLAWVIRQSGITAFTVAQSRTQLGERIQAFRDAIIRRDKNSGVLGRELHALLVDPLGLATDERLVVVPHGALHYLPFQALGDARGYLIERHAVSYAPSAGVALQLARRAPASSSTFVAFGNPGVDARMALPAAEREVQQIGALFNERKIFIKNEASTAQFRSQAGNGAILHVAAHAEVDLIDPLQSRILLAPDKNDTGFLNARQVYDVDLKNVSLVTLSACESGLGRIANGDEIQGFTRAFLSAGASALFVSLWPVADESTEQLMTHLYGDLAAGKEAAKALQAAQVSVLKQPRFAHPFFWAPFDLVGNGRLQIANKTIAAQ